MNQSVDGYVWAAHDGRGRLYVAIPYESSPRNSTEWRRCDIASLPGATLPENVLAELMEMKKIWGNYAVADATRVGLIPKDGSRYYFSAIFGPVAFDAENGVPCCVNLMFVDGKLAANRGGA